MLYALCILTRLCARLNQSVALCVFFFSSQKAAQFYSDRLYTLSLDGLVLYKIASWYTKATTLCTLRAIKKQWAIKKEQISLVLYKQGTAEFEIHWGQIYTTRAKSQWIVGQSPLSHLQYPDAFKSSTRDLSFSIS